MKKGYIFDFDGVICNTEYFHYLSWKRIAEKLSVDFSEEEYLPFRSTGRKTVISHLLNKKNIPFDDTLYNELCELKSSEYSNLTISVGKADLINGVYDYIRFLRSENFSLAVASSGSFASTLLKRLDLYKYFDVVVDGTFPFPKKPNPTVFLKTAEFLKLPVSDCVVFEDSVSGITAAKNGGFFVVGVGGVEGDISIKDFTERFEL